MLTPQQIIDIIETLYPQIDELNVWITTDIVKRIMARLARGEQVSLSETDKWQLQVFQEAGGHLEAVQREIARWTRATDVEIRHIFEDAGIKALAYDNAFYAARGLAEINLAQSERYLPSHSWHGPQLHAHHRAGEPTAAYRGPRQGAFPGDEWSNLLHPGCPRSSQQRCVRGAKDTLPHRAHGYN